MRNLMCRRQPELSARGRFLLLAILLVGVRSGVVSAEAAAAPQSLTLAAPQLAGSPGDTLDVAISLGSVIGVTELSAMKFAVRVDTMALRPLDAVAGAALAAWPAEDFHAIVDGDRLSVSALTATAIPIAAGELVRMRFLVRPEALDGLVSVLDITATNDEQSIVMLIDPDQAPPGVKTIDVDGSAVVTNGFTCVRGDASGDAALGTDDAILTLRLAAGLVESPSAQLLCGADADSDRSYTPFDAAWILSRVVGLPLGKEPASQRPLVRLEAGDDELLVKIDGASAIRAADFRLLVPAPASWSTPRGPEGALLVSGTRGDQLLAAMASTRSLGSSIEFRVPIRDASQASLVHLRLYGPTGSRLPFEVREPTAAWSRTPGVAVAALRLGSYPNPFNPSTTLRFEVPRAGRATLEIFDAAGRRVTRLLDEAVSAGVHTVEWHGVDSQGGAVSSGVYFARLLSEGQQARRRLLLVK